MIIYSENKQANQLFSKINRRIKTEKISQKVKSLNRQKRPIIFMLKFRVTSMNTLFSTKNLLSNREITRRTSPVKIK